MKESEEWRTAQIITMEGETIVFEGYQVSNLGRVKSLNYRNTGKPGILKQGTLINKDGKKYRQVRLSKGYTCRVHRLVCSTFDSAGYFIGALVDHIKAKETLNNRTTNLRWVTCQQNSDTPHCRAARSKTISWTKNRKDLSKKVKVTFLDDNHVEIFPSAREADRALGLPSHTAAAYINQNSGFHKKLNLLFEYM